jgi:hypothetical protein
MPPEEQTKSTTNAVNISTVPLLETEEGVFQAYANVVNMDWTLLDLRLRFGELTQDTDPEKPTWANQHSVIWERAAITMPWHQVKTLSKMLSDIVRSYEELNGELKPIHLRS